MEVIHIKYTQVSYGDSILGSGQTDVHYSVVYYTGSKAGTIKTLENIHHARIPPTNSSNSKCEV